MKKSGIKNMVLWGGLIFFFINISFTAVIVWKSYFNNSSGQMQKIQSFIEADLNLDDKQKKLFYDINIEYHKNYRLTKNKLEEMRIALLREFSATVSDSLALQKYSEEIGNIHKKLKDLTIWHYNEIMKILNPDQQILYKQIYKEMILISPQPTNPHGSH